MKNKTNVFLIFCSMTVMVCLWGVDIYKGSPDNGTKSIAITYVLGYFAFFIFEYFYLLASNLFTEVEFVKVLCRFLRRNSEKCHWDPAFNAKPKELCSLNWDSVYTIRMASNIDTPLKLQVCKCDREKIAQFEYTGHDNNFLSFKRKKFSSTSGFCEREHVYDACNAGSIPFKHELWYASLNGEEINMKRLDDDAATLEKEVGEVFAVALLKTSNGDARLIFIAPGLIGYRRLMINRNSGEVDFVLIDKAEGESSGFGTGEYSRFCYYLQILLTYRSFSGVALSGFYAFLFNVKEMWDVIVREILQIKEKILMVVVRIGSFLFASIFSLSRIWHILLLPFALTLFARLTLVQFLPNADNADKENESWVIISTLAVVAVLLAVIGLKWLLGERLHKNFKTKFQEVLDAMNEKSTLLVTAKECIEGVGVDEFYIRCPVPYFALSLPQNDDNIVLACEGNEASSEKFPCKNQGLFATPQNIYGICKFNTTLARQNKSKFTPIENPSRRNDGREAVLDELNWTAPLLLQEITYNCWRNYRCTEAEKIKEYKGPLVDIKKPLKENLLFNLCMHIIVYTADGFVVQTQKSMTMDNERGRFSFSIEEQLDQHDFERPNSSEAKSCSMWLERALREELAIGQDDYSLKDAKVFSIFQEHFTTYGYDKPLPNLAVCVYVKTKISSKALAHRMSIGLATDREVVSLAFQRPFRLLCELRSAIRSNSALSGARFRWHPTSGIRILHFLCYHYGSFVVFQYLRSAKKKQTQ